MSFPASVCRGDPRSAPGRRSRGKRKRRRDGDVLGIQPLQRLALPRLVRHPDAHPPLERVCGTDDAAKGDAQRGPHHWVCVADRELRGACRGQRSHPVGRAQTHLDALPSHVPNLHLDPLHLQIRRVEPKGTHSKDRSIITSRRTTYTTLSTPSSVSTLNRCIADPEIV